MSERLASTGVRVVRLRLKCPNLNHTRKQRVTDYHHSNVSANASCFAVEAIAATRLASSFRTSPTLRDTERIVHVSADS